MAQAQPFSTSRSIVTGYQLLSTDGGIFCFGDAVFEGSPADNAAGRTWTALRRWGEGTGVVAVASDGTTVFLGDHGLVAGGEESLPSFGSPVVDVEVSPAGRGYWLLDAVGGVFCFGDALFHGSVPGLDLDRPSAEIVGMASTRSGMGYWIVDRVGGVYAFGDAEFYGSVPALRLSAPAAPAVALVVTPTGEGYQILEADGTIRAFGDAPEVDGIASRHAVEATAFARGPHSSSILVVDRRGFVFPVGVAPMFGSAAAYVLDAPIVGVVVFSEPAAVSAT